MGETTPVFSIVHRRSREASHRTAEWDLPLEWEEEEPLAEGREGGNSLATQRSPCGEGVRR